MSKSTWTPTSLPRLHRLPPLRNLGGMSAIGIRAKQITIWGTVVALLTALASAQQTPVRPVEAILEAPPRVVFEDGRAVLTLETTIPVACVVVYGQTPDFGAMAFDQGMGQSAHRVHRVVFPKLKAGSRYFYRLQGSDARGNLYQSQIYTFSTPGETKTPPGPYGSNLALARLGTRVIAKSSNYAGAADDEPWGAQNAIDGDPSTEWSSNGDGDRAWITVALPRPAEIRAVGFWTRTMGDSAQIESFRLEDEKGRVYGPFRLPDAKRLYVFPLTARGQRFTFRVVRSSGGNTGAVEIALFGEFLP